jgi:hypothetical protein
MKIVIQPKRIRIRWLAGTGVASLRTFALACSSLLTPCALVAFTMTFWSIAADMRWTSSFFLSDGLFSHWQMWLASAAVLLLSARVLAQYAGENRAKYH